MLLVAKASENAHMPDDSVPYVLLYVNAVVLLFMHLPGID